MGSLATKLRSLLSRPRAAEAVVVLSLLLMLPGLPTGLSADDYIHMMRAQGSHAIAGFVSGPLDLFRFGSAELTPLLMREGIVSWWAEPSAELGFFRPLSALTHLVDYTLWPDAPWAMHLQSLLWGALALFGVLAFYRRLSPNTLLLSLSTALYALDDGRSWFVAWVAARNAVVATAISVWALYYYDRGRRGCRYGRALAPVLYVLALLAGDGAIALCAYVFAHALFLDEAPLRERVRALVPFAGVTVAWRVAYRALGYGVRGSGLYFDPLGQPLAYLGALVERGPILLLSQLGGPWSDAYTALYPYSALLHAWWIVAVVAIALFGWVLAPLWRSEPLFRFGVTGALLSVLPASAVFCADRMLSWVALGASLAMAVALSRLLDGRDAFEGARRRIGPPLLLLFAASSLFFGPLLLPSRARGNLAMREILDRAQHSVPSDPSIAERFVVYLNAPATPMAGYVPIERAARGVPRPGRQYWLSAGVDPVTVEGVDDHTLRVTPARGFAADPQSWLLRDPRDPFHVGDTVALDGLTVTVERLTEDGRPAVARARFDAPLDDPAFLWLRWQHYGYAATTPPAPGERLQLPAIDHLRMILGPTVFGE